MNRKNGKVCLICFVTLCFIYGISQILLYEELSSDAAQPLVQIQHNQTKIANGSTQSTPQCSITIPHTNITLNNIYNIKRDIFTHNYNINNNNINNITHCISHYMRYNQSQNTLNALYGTIGIGRFNYIFPTAKIMIQTSPKTGSSTMKDLFNSVKKHFNYSFGKNYMFSNKNDIFNILCSSEYRRIFFIRDPLSRLLSGYLDKCTLTTRTSYGHYQLDTCGKYLNYTKNKYKLASNEVFINSKYNTFSNFISWINLGYNTDTHFKSLSTVFKERDLIKNDWQFVDIKNINLWIFILKSVLTENEFKSDFMKKLRNGFRIYCENELTQIKLKETFGVTASASNADKKLLKYFTSLDVLYDALIYTLKDYKYFNLRLPKWINRLFEMKNVNYSKPGMSYL